MTPAWTDALWAWRISSVSRQAFTGDSRPMPDSFSYQFANGAVDIGDMPCRQSWQTQSRTQGALPSDLSFPDLYSGLDPFNIDFSDFCPRPILTRRYLRTYVTASEETSATIRISTCGILQLWCNDKPVLTHRVQTRNQMASTTLNLSLTAGEQILTVLLEELHERDTRCFFSIELIDGEGLSQSWLPRAEQMQALPVGQFLAAFKNLTTDMLVHPPTLTFRSPAALDHDIAFRLLSLQPSGRGGLWDLMPQIVPQPIDVVLQSGTLSAELTLPDNLPGGSAQAVIEAYIGDFRIERTLGMVLHPPCVRISGQNYADRKQQVLQACSAHPGYDPSTAHVLMSVDRDAALDLLDRTITTVEQRQDCSDFNLLGLFWFVKHADQLPSPVVERLQNALLNYRYWLDEPGDDVMWFWSENHALCFHVAQALAGQYFPNKLFSAGKKPGAAVKAMGESRLQQWFDALETNGLAEYNSAAYYPIDLLALLTLFDYSDDPELVRRARQLLDEIVAMVALHSLGGTPAGAQGRAYEKELLAGVGTELGSVVALLFGGQFMPGFDRSVMLLCLSDYAPPEKLLSYARPAANAELTARYRQGASDGGHLYLFKTADVQLSSATGHNAGDHGHQQHLVDVQFADASDARAWINHPGDATLWSELRPSYLAGNLCLPRIAQHGNQAMLLFDLAKTWNPYRWVNVFAQAHVIRIESFENWLFLQSGRGMAAIWGSSLPVQQRDDQADSCVWRCHDDKLAFVLRVSSVGQLGNLAKFRRDCLHSPPVFDRENLAITTMFDNLTVSLAFDSCLRVDGIEQTETSANVWPHVSKNGGLSRYWRDRT